MNEEIGEMFRKTLRKKVVKERKKMSMKTIAFMLNLL